MWGFPQLFSSRYPNLHSSILIQAVKMLIPFASVIMTVTADTSHCSYCSYVFVESQQVFLCVVRLFALDFCEVIVDEVKG